MFLCRYSAAHINSTKEEVSENYKKTRKLLTMHKAHHSKDDVRSLCIKRTEKGRRLISIEEFVVDTIAWLHRFCNTEIFKGRRRNIALQDN